MLHNTILVFMFVFPAKVRARYPELTDVFAQGAPASCLENLAPELGITNGSQGLMHSLVYDEREDMSRLEQLIESESYGNVCWLQYPPTAICVKVTPPAEVPANLARDFSTSIAGGADTFVIPFKQAMKLKIIKQSNGRKQAHAILRYHNHDAIIGFAMTIHSCQGFTLPKVIVDFNTHPAMPLSLYMVYVALSRVSKTTDIRLLTPLTQASIAKLTELAHSNDLVQWWTHACNSGTFPRWKKTLEKVIHRRTVVSKNR